MNSFTNRITQMSLLLGLSLVGRAVAAGSPAPSAPRSEDSRFKVGGEIAADDFENGLGQWQSELEKGGTVSANNGVMEIDVPAGCTVWWTRRFAGPIMISYEAKEIKDKGPNDRVSDLNCFWMANDSRSPEGLLTMKRTGRFSDYDQLRCYYVGLGGNSNSTTRFRRYIGQKGNRPLLPEHDLSDRQFLLTPNVWQRVTLIAAGSTIEYYRDGRRLFAYEDPQPYLSGWFAVRTTFNHMQLRHFRAYRLQK